MSDRAIPIDGRSYQVDGRAVARRAIPDSALIQYLMDEGGGTALADNTGNGNSGTLVGAGWSEDANAVGGWQTTYDGVDDYGEVDNSGGIEHAAFTVIITVEIGSGSIDNVNPLISKGPTRFGSGPASWSLEHMGADAGEINMRVRDGSLIEPKTTTTITNADTKFQAIGRVEEGNQVSVGINGQIEESLSVGTLEKLDDPIDWMSDQDNDDFYVEGAVGTIEYHTEALSDAAIEDRYNNLPWS